MDKEMDVLIKHRDEEGNIENHYPVTKVKNVLGLSELLKDYDGIIERILLELAGKDGFDFDNLMSLPGVSRETVAGEGRKVTETMVVTETGIRLAERVTAVTAEGIHTHMVLYDTDGETALKKVNIETSLAEDGVIKEVVTDGIK